MPQFKPKRVGGRPYDLSHLDPFNFNVTHEAASHVVRVTFEDHVFTEKHDPARHTPDLIYSRRQNDWRAFDIRRWELSKGLPDLFRKLGGASVYASKGRNFFVLRGPAGGDPYAVFFDALKSDRSDADVAVIVRSAYEKPGMALTAQPVRFPRLIDATAQGVRPTLGPRARIKRQR